MMMYKNDNRFSIKVIKSLIGKNFIKYKHINSIFTNSVTGLLEFEIDDHIYILSNEYEHIDYLSLDNEAVIFRISKTDRNTIDSIINNDINEIIVNEVIKKIILVNDHITVKTDENTTYDIWETKAIIFYFNNYELCFSKQDCWFSQEIEIYKGNDVFNYISDGKDILNDFDKETQITIERTIIPID